MEKGDPARESIGLAGVPAERLQLSDGAMAFDLDGRAGEAIRLLAALLGPGAVSQPALAGIAIGLFDSGLNAAYIARMGLDAIGVTTAPELIAVLRAHLGAGEAERPAASTLQGLLASGMSLEDLALWAADQPALSTAIDFSGLRERGVKYLAYTPPSLPDYRVIAGSERVGEGEAATFAVIASRGQAGATVTYSIEGVSAADIAPSPLAGQVRLDASGQGSLRVALAVDQATEGEESLVVALPGATATTRIVDTSTTPAPRFELTALAASVDEGQYADFLLRTERVAPGTSVAYVIGGEGIEESDLFFGPLRGEAMVGLDGTALIRVGLQADGATEGPEEVHVSYGDARASMWVNDLSIGLVGGGGQGNDGTGTGDGPGAGSDGDAGAGGDRDGLG